MAHPIVFVDIPDKLNGDSYQPSSIMTPGPVKQVGSVELKGTEVYDPDFDDPPYPADKVFKGQFASMEKFELKEKYNLKHTALKIAGITKDQGYQMIRTQWYEEVDTHTIGYEDSATKSTGITLGTSRTDGHETSTTVGVEFGTSVTDSNESNIEVGLEIKFLKLGGGVKSGHSVNTSTKISDSLQVSDSRSNFRSEATEKKFEYTANGGNNGARYVSWQIVDRIQLIRKSDKATISDTHVRSYIQTSKYEFTSKH